MIIHVLILITYFSILHAQTNTIPIPHGSTLNFTVNLNNIQEARATNSQTITKPQTPIVASDSPLLDKLSSVWIDPHTNKTLIQRLGDNTGSIFNENKWTFLLGVLASGYGYCCYVIASGNHYLAQKDLWSSWRQDLTLEQLLAIPQPQFAKELLQEIQRRYTEPAAITDIVRPLGTFMRVIEEEEQQLAWYQNTFAWIEYAHLKSIIFLNTAPFSKIAERLARISYLKNVFHTWAAQYQLEQANTARRFVHVTEITDVTSMAALMAYHYKISLLHYLAQKQLSTTPIA